MEWSVTVLPCFANVMTYAGNERCAHLLVQGYRKDILRLIYQSVGIFLRAASGNCRDLRRLQRGVCAVLTCEHETSAVREKAHTHRSREMHLKFFVPLQALLLPCLVLEPSN